VIGMGDVIDEKQNTGDNLYQITHKRDRSQRMKHIDVTGQPVFGQVRSDKFIEPYSYLKPVFDPLSHLHYPITI
jgi:hypothetical protein